MDPIEKKELVKKFINPDLCKITEDLICSDPAPTIDMNTPTGQDIPIGERNPREITHLVWASDRSGRCQSV